MRSFACFFPHALGYLKSARAIAEEVMRKGCMDGQKDLMSWILYIGVLLQEVPLLCAPKPYGRASTLGLWPPWDLLHVF